MRTNDSKTKSVDASGPIKCPHCGKPLIKKLYGLLKKHDFAVHCPNCNKDFKVKGAK